MFSTHWTRFSPGIIRLTPNVAVAGTATQSSTYGPSSQYAASNAIDGNYATDPYTGACAIANFRAPVWWQVELQNTFEISKVAIATSQWTCEYWGNISE